MITHRDLDSVGNRLDIEHESKKKASEEDVMTLHHRMTSHGIESLDHSSDFSKARRLLSVGKGRAFSKEVVGAEASGDLQAYMSDEETDDEDDGGAAETNNEAEDIEKKSATGSEARSDGKADEKKVWSNRDEILTAELCKMGKWYDDQKIKLTDVVQKMAQTLSGISENVRDKVENERRLTQNRLTALKLLQATAAGPLGTDKESAAAQKDENHESGTQAATQNDPKPVDPKPVEGIEADVQVEKRRIRS